MARWAAAIACGAGSVGAIGAVLWMAAIPSVAGCYTHQCDPSAVSFDGGSMVDQDTYETNGFDEQWLAYPPNVTLTVNFPPSLGANRVPLSVDAYIGTTSTPNAPNDSGINFTSGAGGVVEYSALNGTSLRVINSTCAFYYARFVVHFVPVAADDASADDAVADDAAADAATDDATDAAAAGDAE